MKLPIQSLWKGILRDDFQECVRKGAAGICSRERPSLKGLRPNRELCETVEKWLEEVWKGQDQTATVMDRLWRLNCLTYCGKTSDPFMIRQYQVVRIGARLVLRIGKDSKLASDASEQVEAEQLDLEDHGDWAPDEAEVATRDQNWKAKLVKRIKALEGRLSGIKRMLNLILAVLTRTRMRGRRPLTRRERFRYGKLCLLLRRKSLPEGALRAEKEHYLALSRIRKAQLDRLQLKSLTTRQAVRLGGPSALDFCNTTRIVYSEEQRSQIVQYWRTIWEVEGHYAYLPTFGLAR